MTKSKNIYVTQPSLPDLNEYTKLLGQIWESKRLTNNGDFHKLFEKNLGEYLNVENISLFSNGTLALIVALKALNITGEVITTPYTFVATTHALQWNGIKPVFCDINKNDFNMDSDKIEALITEKTTAIMPVHIYGNPCQNDKIQKIADKYGLKVIYDAAHAFGVDKNEKSILDWGDMSILSFHATKVFNTVEGGAIVSKDKEMKKRIDYLKNFGFANETTVVGCGINGKMNELIAAYGLLQLKNIDTEIAKLKKLVKKYRLLLSNINGIRILDDFNNVKHNYSYFPILVDKEKYGKTRDELYNILRENGILVRRYFYPLISQFPPYTHLPSAKKGKLPVAEKITEQILCLPIYSDIEKNTQNEVVDIIKMGRV